MNMISVLLNSHLEEAAAMILFGIGFTMLLLHKNLIKKIMGLSPVSFLRSYRLARAMDLIRSSQSDNLSTIESSVGHKHLSHFSREFKNFTGVTPSEYKAECYHI